MGISPRISQIFKPRVKRAVSFDDDIIRDVAAIDDKYTEKQIKHVFNSTFAEIKKLFNDPEFVSLKTPVGVFYTRVSHMEAVKQKLQNYGLKNQLTKNQKARLEHYIYKTQFINGMADFLEKQPEFTGKRRQIFPHKYKSLCTSYTYSKEEIENFQNTSKIGVL
jgi:hypothetical protein